MLSEPEPGGSGDRRAVQRWLSVSVQWRWMLAGRRRPTHCGDPIGVLGLAVEVEFSGDKRHRHRVGELQQHRAGPRLLAPCDRTNAVMNVYELENNRRTPRGSSWLGSCEGDTLPVIMSITDCPTITSECRNNLILLNCVLRKRAGKVQRHGFGVPRASPTPRIYVPYQLINHTRLQRWLYGVVPLAL